MKFKTIKKSFLTILITASILVVNLAAVVLTFTGTIDDDWTDASIARLMRGVSGDTSFQSNTGEDDIEVLTEPETETAEEAELPEMPEPVTNEFVTVDDTYFSDALFIGDSRVGMVYFWNGIPGMTYYYDSGISIYDALKNKFCAVDSGKMTLADALAANPGRFKKVYLEFGANGNGYDFLDQYETANLQIIDMILETQPEAIIFLVSCMKVTEAMSSSDSSTLTNEKIDRHNNILETLADHDRIFYIDINDYCCDENGVLRSDWTNDGYHLDSSYTYIWRDCFLDHGIVR